ncbi:Gamma-glutamyl phosphate reductase [Nitrospira tepida]|uniref:Gamma-glutamyl phosphate reductase n=1 Tax=Nitrospira tepida TaxID=2973512 RepID=A0AA86N0K7_9BACT|nr:glutamate-5-semialdehyde dehydrogenase [Nitrospira tepida]CAI4032518.1 Gamma-glutamyl phosphate reductase [Nitrospira tepida]
MPEQQDQQNDLERTTSQTSTVSVETPQGEAQQEPELSVPEYVRTLVTRARSASSKLASLSSHVKNQALLAMAEALEAKVEDILAENEKDLAAYGENPEKQASADRLKLTPERIAEMARGVRAVANLPDPLGSMPKMWTRPNGMQVGRVRVPIGVIGIIYESRPNVTVDSAVLCLKSGNVCVLRGGSDAIQTNRMLAKILSDTADAQGIPPGAISFVDRPDREVVEELLKQDRDVDLIIPRGGPSLMKTVAEHATIPVLKHDEGVCHVYVDQDADLAMAETICLNAKVQRPSTCNAMEGLLVNQVVARTFLPALVNKLHEAGVEVRGCPKTLQLCPDVKPAAEDDFGKEFLSRILAVRIVKHLDEALDHIAKYGSRHTEAIVTNDYARAMRFLREVDASAVMVNASTRLNDGYQFGLGAEIGISTSRIHARGPMGLEELTCSKFIVMGSGQIRE